MNKKTLSERDICTKFITPALEQSGWDIQTQIREEVSFTDGRIYVRGKLHTRGAKKRADYILYYKPNIPIAVIEAKDNKHSVSAGMQQAKVNISRSVNRTLSPGDAVVFYRAAGQGGKYKSVVTTIGIVESVIDGIGSESEFVLKCRKRSVFSDAALKEHWDYNKYSRPFIVKFLYAYSFPKRPNMAKLIELGIIADVKSAPRGFEPISKEQFYTIIKESQSNEGLIVD